jgi:DNA (cytosine-5)-methyltransferase 1
MRLLDLFCGAGGAARGYQQTGFHVTGVDVRPQPRCTGDVFVQCDAIAYLISHWDEFDAVHASPPCQAHSDLQKQSKRFYLDLIAATRAILTQLPLPYIIENVEGAPLINPVILCGAMFPELRVYRHRLFEASWPLEAPRHPRHRDLTFTHDKRKAHYGRPLDLTTMRVQVTGGGNAPVWAKAHAMGIDWMTGAELNEAIPPAFPEHVGHSLQELDILASALEGAAHGTVVQRSAPDDR